MNHFNMKKISTLLFVVISFCFISCGGSEENSTASSPTTNEIPLIVPDNAATTPLPSTDTATTLYHTWALDSINGKAPDSNYFSLGSPYLIFDSLKKTISGFGGCNGINAKLKVTGQRLAFDSLTVSSQQCKGQGKEFERKLLAGFRSGRTTYKIQNGFLHLNVGGGSIFILRKIG